MSAERGQRGDGSSLRRHRLKASVHIAAAAVLASALVAGTAWAIRAFVKYVGAVPKELGAPLIAAAATVLVATLTVMVGRHYERKKELDALYRDKKTEIYDEFLREFFGLYFSAGKSTGADASKDLVPFLREFTRKLVLWSGPDVIESFVAWKDHLAKGSPDAKTIFLTEAFLLSIRRDLRHTNTGLRKGFFARLFLKEGNLFLAMAEKDPNVTLAALAEIERSMKDGAKGGSRVS